MCGSATPPFKQDTLSKEEIALLLPMSGAIEPAPEPTGSNPSNEAGIAAASGDNMPHFVPADQPRRIPCKARGLTAGHNADTAYFDIPPNPRHGMLLVCSHPACVRSGRRFRYCVVCELPVAKRNFMKRHAHNLVASRRSSDYDTLNTNLPLLEDEDKVQLQQEQQQQQHFCQEIVPAPTAGTKHHRSVSYDAADALAQGFAAANRQQNKRPRIAATSQPSQETNNIAQLNWPSLTPDPLLAGAEELLPKTSPTKMESEANKVVKELTEREVKWLDLLYCRPAITDDAGTANWLEEVFQASEAQPANVGMANQTAGVQLSEQKSSMTGLGPEKMATLQALDEQPVNVGLHQQTTGEPSTSEAAPPVLEMPKLLLSDLKPLMPNQRRQSADSVNLKEFLELFN